MVLQSIEEINQMPVGGAARLYHRAGLQVVLVAAQSEPLAKQPSKNAGSAVFIPLRPRKLSSIQ